MSLWVGAQDHVNSAKNARKHAPIMMSSTESQNEKNFLKSKL